MDGTIIGTAIAAAMGKGPVTPELINLGTAIADYIMDESDVSLAAVTGVCAAGGGPVSGMAGTGGTIV